MPIYHTSTPIKGRELKEGMDSSSGGVTGGPRVGDFPSQASRWLGLLAPWSPRFRKYFPLIGFWIGVFAAIYFWVAVIYDGHLNSNWWSFTSSSFSALGDPDATDARGLAWIYSDTIMIPTGIMMMVFGAAMVLSSRNKVEVTGSGFFMQAGVFLSLIGVYNGSYGQLHDFISTWFFVWAAVAILTWGLGLLLERRWRLGLCMLLLVIVGTIFASWAVHFFQWSVAETEAYGIVIIDSYLALMYFGRNPAAKP